MVRAIVIKFSTNKSEVGNELPQSTNWPPQLSQTSVETNGKLLNTEQLLFIYLIGTFGFKKKI